MAYAFLYCPLTLGGRSAADRTVTISSNRCSSYQVFTYREKESVFHRVRTLLYFQLKQLYRSVQKTEEEKKRVKVNKVAAGSLVGGIRRLWWGSPLLIPTLVFFSFVDGPGRKAGRARRPKRQLSLSLSLYSVGTGPTQRTDGRTQSCRRKKERANEGA